MKRHVATCDRCGREAPLTRPVSSTTGPTPWVLPEKWVHCKNESGTHIEFDLCDQCAADAQTALPKRQD